MNSGLFPAYEIDYVELYTPMAKALAYWHTHALNFTVVACADADTGLNGRASYVLDSGNIKLVLTSSYPPGSSDNEEVTSFITQNYCGVKRIALRTPFVKESFERSVANGAIPLKYPFITEDGSGHVEEASIRLYDHSEITFINRDGYSGIFKPGYAVRESFAKRSAYLLDSVDHIAAEVRINEMDFWTRYLSGSIGTNLVQRIARSEENKTGMVLNINQSPDRKLTFVLAEPETYLHKSKIQKNIERFGPGIHHLAFATANIVAATTAFTEQGVDFVKFPPSYFDLLRSNEDFKGIDIDELQRNNILIDKEDDTFLLQKFIKPISDRPFFLYEIVQRVNGYSGFALKNINVLKKAEEMEIMKVAVS